MKSVISLEKCEKKVKHCQRCKERKSRSVPRPIHAAFLFSVAVILKANKDEASSSLNTQLNCDTEPLSFHYCPLFLQLHLYFHVFCKAKANQTRSNPMQSSGRYCVRSPELRGRIEKKEPHSSWTESEVMFCASKCFFFFFLYYLILSSCILFSTAKPQSQNCTLEWKTKGTDSTPLFLLNVTLSAPVKKDALSFSSSPS